MVSSFGGTSKAPSNAITRLFSDAKRAVFKFPRRHAHRNAGLPLRSKKDRGRRRKPSIRFPSMLILLTGVMMMWRLSSFTVIDSSKEDNTGPLWTTCPAKDNENTDDHDRDGGGAREDICFVTCIFGDNVGEVDRPANVEWFDRYWCYTRFLLVTNLPDLPAPGWKTIVANTTTTTATGSATATDAVETTQRHIVESRHAKFVAWDVLPETTERCSAVVYMDGYLTPVRYTSWRSLLSAAVTAPPWSPASPLFPGSLWGTSPRVPPPPKFQSVVRQVRNHPWGLSQVKQKYFDGLPMTTLLRNLVRDRKDTEEHVEATLGWFRSQAAEDFDEIMPYYLNKYFGEC